MEIITADYIITCDNEFSIICDGAIVFDTHIIDIGTTKDILHKYPSLEIINTQPNSIIMPGLINSHTHLEYSNNRNILKYGDFSTWLGSVFDSRGVLIENLEPAIKKQLEIIKRSGTTTICEISSFGKSLKQCEQSPLNVIYFNEILGTNEQYFEFVKDDFDKRLNESIQAKNSKLIPAISVHSTYAVHPEILQHGLDKAKDYDMLVSTHFLESEDELNWLEQTDKKLGLTLQKVNPNIKPFYTPSEFMSHFDMDCTSFVHCCYDDAASSKYTVHCPVSNRLLGSKTLDISKLNDKLLLGTDGLSSNTSLSLWDEMRMALMVHHKYDLQKLSKKLLLSVTKNAGEFLKLPIGVLQEGFKSDFVVVSMEQDYQIQANLDKLILHTKEVQQSFINGEQIV